MRVYIVSDLEGVCGVVSPEDMRPGGSGYRLAAQMLTGEVQAAAEGAVSAGATSVLHLNGHGHAYDVVYGDLEPPAEHIVGSPWDRYLPGLDESIGLVFQIGAHARSGTPRAVLEHTMSSVEWVSFRVNGREMGEMGLIGLCAAHFGVPVAFVSGDAAACREAETMFPNVLTVATKHGLGRTAARLRPRQAVLSEIRAVAAEAVSSPGHFRALNPAAPCELEIDYLRTSSLDRRGPREGASREGGRTLRVTGSDVFDALGRLH